MALIKRSSMPLAGVDISSTAVKLLALSRSGQGYHVEHYALEPLPAGAVVEKSIADIEAVGAAVGRAVAKAGLRGKGAAAAVPGAAAITKVIPMPAGLSEDDLEAQVELEAANHIPYPLEEVSYDFNVLGPMPNSQDTLEVLLVASRSENVENRQAALELGGLTTRVMDVEPFAIENAFALIAPQLGIGREGLVALADVGATTTTLNVLQDGRSIYQREQVFGGRQLTDEVMRRYGLGYDEALRAIRHGGLPDTYEVDVLESFKDSLSQNVGRLLQFFFASSEYNRVEQLVLAGGGAGIAGITQLLEEQQGVPTVVANPLARMTLDKRVQANALAADAPALMIACGLALRSFD